MSHDTSPADVTYDFIPAPAAPRPPVQLALIDFLRLFTGDEIDRFNAREAEAKALAASVYEAAAAGDPAARLMVGFRRGLTHYDALRAGLIELDHPDTVAWLQLLVPLGVLTAPRLAQVLAGERPEAT